MSDQENSPDTVDEIQETVEETAQPLPDRDEDDGEAVVGYDKSGFVGYAGIDVDDVEVEIDADPLSARPVDKPVAFNLSFGYTDFDGMIEYMDQYSGFEYGKEQAPWAAAFNYSASIASSMNNAYRATVNRSGSRWGQYVEHEGVKLRPARVKLADAQEDGERLTGERAARRVRALTTPGAVVQIPLWHSGLWLSIKAPKLTAYVELERRIALEKVTLGRETRGAAFSNDGVYIHNHLVDFLLAHTFDTNLENWTPDIVKAIISYHDIQHIAWAMQLVMYPNGFPYSNSCTNDPAKCTHTTREVINLARLQWIDRSKLTEKQRKHMRLRNRRFKLDAFETYRDEFAAIKTTTVVIDNNMSLVLTVPSVHDHIESGVRWVDGIVEMTEAAFGVELRGNARQEYIRKQARALRIRNYAHWITSVVINTPSGQQIIDDPDSLDGICDDWSSEKEVAEKIIDAIVEYAHDTCIAVIGIPNYPCPSCGAWHLTEGSPTKTIIPVDAVSVFFSLQQFKIEQEMG